MMISSAQLNDMSSRVLDSYSRDAATRLIAEHPDWQPDASMESRQSQIAEIIRYGQQLGLKDDATLYGFAAGLLRFNLQIPLSQSLQAEFRQGGLSRAAQLENMLLRLLSGRDSRASITL